MFIKYNVMKYILLKHFRNNNVIVELKGAIDTRLYIKKARILISNNKVVISDGEDVSFSFNRNFIFSIKKLGKFKIVIDYKNITVDLQY